MYNDQNFLKGSPYDQKQNKTKFIQIRHAVLKLYE